jgi:hypothetical protein
LYGAEERGGALSDCAKKGCEPTWRLYGRPAFFSSVAENYTFSAQTMPDKAGTSFTRQQLLYYVLNSLNGGVSQLDIVSDV